MNDYSQAGQTTFVHALHPWPGTFLDIGAAGLSISNTLGLEEIGWRGFLVDNSPEAQEASKERRNSIFILTDATRLDYENLPSIAPIVDYLSLDVDQASLSVLFQLPLDKLRFRIITAEHDQYRNGETLRTPMLNLLKNAGYDILCADVCHEGMPFEIWAVDPNLVDMSIANKFRRDKPTEWKEILGL